MPEPRLSLNPQTKRELDGLMSALDTTGVTRRRFVKMLGLGGALAAAGTSLAACSATGTSASVVTSGNLALLNLTTDDYITGFTGGFQAASAALGFSNGVVLDAQLDAGTQFNQFGQQIAQKKSAILLAAVDSSAAVTYAQQANDNKTYLSSVFELPAWTTPWDFGTYYDSFLVDDESVGIKGAIDLLAEAIDGKGKVLRVGFIKGSNIEEVRESAALKALEAYPEITLADQLYGANSEAAQEAAASLLAKHPDAVGIIAFNDDVALGVISAIEAAGKKPGTDILVIGANGTGRGVEAIENGTLLATTGNVPSYPSALAVARFYDRLNGWEPTPAERAFCWVPVVLDKDSVGAYKARYVDLPVENQFDYTRLSRIKSPNNWDLQFEAYPIEDLQSIWPNVPKPAGYELPTDYVKAQQTGDFERVRQLYKDHYTIPLLGPSPVA